MTRADKNLIDRTVTAALRPQCTYGPTCCITLLVKIRNVLLIIIPPTCLLGLTQDGLKVALKLVLFVLCPVQVLIGCPLQAPGPYLIPIVFDLIYDLLVLRVHEQGRHRPTREVYWVRSGLRCSAVVDSQFRNIFLLQLIMQRVLGQNSCARNVCLLRPERV
jgi:hypothetical protein